MALSDENTGLIMPVQPSGGGFGGGGFGGDGWWILLLLLFAGGFGNGGFGGGNNGIYPWMNQADITTSGFQNAATQNAISGIQGGVTSGFGDLQTALCGGFAGVNAAITNAQMNSLERSFAAQTANTQALSGISAQLSQCCCDNRLATVQTQNIVQSEGAATRLAIQNQTQQILDRLCEQEIEQLRSQNVALQNQVNMLNLSASQTAQTAALVADNAAQTQYLINRLAPAAV
ncbi:MAG: hypothetical protein IKX20_07790 [Paludibacteraceae bacterium]|nr:hypothetical protein [Paludibacteraceae bacterium]